MLLGEKYPYLQYLFLLTFIYFSSQAAMCQRILNYILIGFSTGFFEELWSYGGGMTNHQS